MEAFNHLMLEYPELLYSGVGATTFLAGGALIYKFVSRYELTRACLFSISLENVPVSKRCLQLIFVVQIILSI